MAAQLRPNVSPCSDLDAPKWALMYEACLDFIERFGAEAARLGWTAPQLFGVHPEHITQRIDWYGVMMASKAKAIGIEADLVRFGNVSGYRTTPGMPTGLPIWVCAASQRKG